MKEGIPIQAVDAKPIVRSNAESAEGWAFREEAQHLYGMATNFKNRFLDPVARVDRGRLPEPVISFERFNAKALAAYTLNRNPQGLLDEITFNTAHYIKSEEGKPVWKFGQWAQYETLLHEQVHLWQQNFGAKPMKPGRNYHNREFVNKCESLGLYPKLGPGYHIAPADGVFAQYMMELRIEPPPPLEAPPKKHWFFEGEGMEGKSTLIKYVCPDCGINVRWGRQIEPQLLHVPCGKLLERG